jgi:chromate transporter
MISDLIYLVISSLFISLVTFGGGAQALFYQLGVSQTHWLSRDDLTAVLAWGYATPGPAVFGIATFIGYKLAGVPGAVIGTIGIFMMPFLLAVFAARYLSHLLNDPHAIYVITGVGLAAAGLVAATAFNLLPHHGMTLWQAVVVLVSFVASLKWKPNPLFILVVAGAIGLLL